jgi:hypothetical protein
MVVGKLGHLANGVAVGDYPPTDSEHEVHQVLREQLRSAQAELEVVLGTDLPEFNRILQERDLPNVIASLQED